MLEREWRGRFLKRIVRHVDETAARLKQIAAAKAADVDPPLKASHEHARLFPYDLIDQQEQAAQRRGAMGRFPQAPKATEPIAPARPASRPVERPTRQSTWHWTKPR